MPAKTDPYVAFLEAKLATEVGPHEARELVDQGSAVILDVRSADSRATGHVPGDLHIPRRELEARIDELPKDKLVVAYCSDLGCQASMKAAIILRKAGIDARHMIGGFRFWTDKGYPTATPSVKAAPVTLKARGK